MNSQTGLDYIIENQEFTQKLATGKTRWILDIKLFYPFNEIYITVVVHERVKSSYYTD